MLSELNRYIKFFIFISIDYRYTSYNSKSLSLAIDGRLSRGRIRFELLGEEIS